jgi:hypothetical protein
MFCVGAKKNLMANQIVKLVIWIFFLTIFNELTVKCVIGFGGFVEFWKTNGNDRDK